MLRELVTDLCRLPPLERAEPDMARMLTLAASAKTVLPQLPRRRDDYTRTLAYGDDRFELLLLDWAAGSASAIHDHGGRHCWFVVLEGQIRVEDFERVDGCDIAGRAVLATRSSRLLTTSDLDLRSGEYDIHRVAAQAHSVTLHVYARPLHEYLVYDQRQSACRAGKASYDRSMQLL